MTRRLLLLLPLAACLRADSERQVVDLIGSAAAGLSAGKPELFLEAFDPAMPGYQKLRADVIGLSSQADLSCSIEVVSNQGDDASRAVELDWILRIDQKTGRRGEPHTTDRRQRTVKCQVRKLGKRWRVVSFEPQDFFALKV
jgi:hypothetical protein